MLKTEQKDGKEIFQLAVKNASPSLEIKSRRIGGANYQVPIEVPRHRQFFSLHIGSLILQDQDLVESMSDRLAMELISAANNEGGAIKRKKILIEWQKLIEPLLILDNIT